MVDVALFAAAGEDAQPASPFVNGPTDLARGSGQGPLAGLRFAVKDLYDVRGTKTGAGNPARLWDVPVAVAHAPIVQALLDAGADLVGKTVTDELAFSLSGTNVHYGTPENPAAPGRVPGGSSSGSASAVRAGMVDFALGTDTGGSTRVPASYCGLFGLRVSHGSLSRDGVFLLAPSFCAPGIFARDGATLARVWRALDTSTAASIPRSLPRRPCEIVMLPEFFALADPSAATALEETTRAIAASFDLPVLAASLDTLGDPALLLDTFRTIQLYEAWQLHGEWVRANRDTLGWGIASRFESASLVDSDAVHQARERRIQFQRNFEEMLGDGRYLAQPAASGPAPPIELDGIVKDDLRRRTMMLTSPAGLAGAPVATLPLGKCDDLPVGLAIVGRPGDDGELAGLAAKVPANMAFTGGGRSHR